MKKQISAGKKLLRLAIVLAIPVAGICILIFNATSSKTDTVSNASGRKDAFNIKMPATHPKYQGNNKLEIYMQTLKDSTRQKDWKGTLYEKPDTDPASTDSTTITGLLPKMTTPALRPSHYVDPNEEKVNKRLEKLYATLNGNSATVNPKSNPMTGSDNRVSNNSVIDIDRLQQLVAGSQRPDAAPDPQMQELGKMVDKLTNLLHPEKLNPSTTPPTAAVKKSVLTVAATTGEVASPQTDNPYELTSDKNSNGFFGLSEPLQASLPDGPTIKAVIHQTKLIHTASTIKLRLLQDMYIAGHLIPRGTFLTGNCTINNERVYILLSSLEYNAQIYPVQLTVFDTDGLEGIPVDGAMTREVTKDGISQGASGMGITSLDPSIGAQAAAAGIETAKTLLSRKLKQVSATLKESHVVLLKNTQVAH